MSVTPARTRCSGARPLERSGHAEPRYTQQIAGPPLARLLNDRVQETQHDVQTISHRGLPRRLAGRLARRRTAAAQSRWWRWCGARWPGRAVAGRRAAGPRRASASGRSVQQRGGSRALTRLAGVRLRVAAPRVARPTPAPGPGRQPWLPAPRYGNPYVGPARTVPRANAGVPEPGIRRAARRAASLWRTARLRTAPGVCGIRSPRYVCARLNSRGRGAPCARGCLPATTRAGTTSHGTPWPPRYVAPGWRGPWGYASSRRGSLPERHQRRTLAALLLPTQHRHRPRTTARRPLSVRRHSAGVLQPGDGRCRRRAHHRRAARRAGVRRRQLCRHRGRLRRGRSSTSTSRPASTGSRFAPPASSPSHSTWSSSRGRRSRCAPNSAAHVGGGPSSRPRGAPLVAAMSSQPGHVSHSRADGRQYRAGGGCDDV